MSRPRIRKSIAETLAVIRGMAEQAEFWAEYGIRRRRPAFVEEGVLAMVEALELALSSLGPGPRNPPVLPGTPAEWRESVRTAVRLCRLARRAKGRVAARLLRRLSAAAGRQRERAVLMARRMKAEFAARWPRLWTCRDEREFWPWYGGRLR